MPSDSQKRKLVKEKYPWPDWEKKVDKMSEAQVHSIYIRMISKKN